MTLEALQAVLAAYLHQNGWSALPPIPYGYEGKTSTLWERPGYMPGWPRQTFFEAVTEQLALDLREDL